MKRDEALALLREGRVEEWNDRSAKGEEIPRLSLFGPRDKKADLSGANLSEANLYQAFLRAADRTRGRPQQGLPLAAGLSNPAGDRPAERTGIPRAEPPLGRGADVRLAG